MSTTNQSNPALSEVLAPGRTPEEMMEYYAKWADNYEQDCAGFRYNPPHLVAGAFSNIYSHNKNIRVLDCGAGTGLVAERLFQLGYTNIDALDASEEMLKKAKLKNLYRNYICDFLGTNRLPIDTGTYDAAITAGSFCEGHLKPDCLVEMTRVVKPGGHVVIGVTKAYLTEVPSLMDLEPTMRRHEKEGIWSMVSRNEEDNYVAGQIGVIYVFRKL